MLYLMESKIALFFFLKIIQNNINAIQIPQKLAYILNVNLKLLLKYFGRGNGPVKLEISCPANNNPTPKKHIHIKLSLNSSFIDIFISFSIFPK